MKTLNKIDEKCKGFCGWTHYLEDGSMVSNETSDGKFIVQIYIIIVDNKLKFNYIILDANYDNIIEFTNDNLSLSDVNSTLKEQGDYYLHLDSETFQWLLCVEHI